MILDSMSTKHPKYRADDGLAFGAAYLIGHFPALSYGISGLIDAKEAVKLSPALVGSETREAKFIGGSCARHHCFLVDDQGDVWGCGNNMSGQLGLVSPHVGLMGCCIDTNSRSLQW